VAFPDDDSRSARLAARASRSLPGGNSRHSVLYPPYPVYAARGEGCRLTDVDGVTRIDAVNNMSSLIHGHGNAAVLQALGEQISAMLSVGAPTEVEIELAEILTGRLPGVDLIRFANSGSEAMMFACRCARGFTSRSGIAKVEGAYHGSYDSVEFGLSPDPSSWGASDAPAPVPATNGIPAGVQQDTIVIPFNDVEAAEAILRAHADSLAAVIIDPVVSRMGFIEASPAYLDMIRSVTRDLDALLIFDEVFSFRIGYHGAQGEVGIKPDITVLGKVIGGGMPIGAVGGSAEVMALFDHSAGPLAIEHSGTFFANPMSMAAGSAALEQLTPEALERLNGLGDYLRAGLRRALDETGTDGYVAGVGSLSALFLAGEPPADYRGFFGVMQAGALERGMALHRFLLNNGVQIIPPGGIVLSTPMTRSDIDEIVEQVTAGIIRIRDGAAVQTA